MIDQQRVLKGLQARYGELTPVRPGVFRAAQSLAGRNYAVRYFDLTGQLDEAATHLREYQEELMADTYFGADSPSDLRWNHYLYFVAADENVRRPNFQKVKYLLESDRTYARKAVFTERDVDALGTGPPELSSGPPLDVATQWTRRLDELGLSFVLDDAVSAPEAARLIGKGVRQPSARQTSLDPLSEAEHSAGTKFLSSLTIQGFRKYPVTKEFAFGSVNLVFGRNGSGKTSLLEAIEFLYCGANKRGTVRLPGIKVSGEFVGSQAKLLASGTLPTLAQQRARNARWYSRTDVKKPTLCDSFGKFNFLDTDAAVHLSREDDSNDRLTADVSRLILGAEAEKLANKMDRVAEKVEAECKEKAHVARDLRQRLTEALSRLDLIRKTPRTSDSIFKGLLDALAQCGWRSSPTSKVGAQDIAPSLQASVVAARRLARSDSLTAASLLEKRRQLDEDLARARKVVLDHHATVRELVAAREIVSVTDKRLQALKGLQRHVQAGLPDKLAELQATKARADQESVRLATVGDAEAELGDDSQLDTELPIVASSVQEEVKKWEATMQERAAAVKSVEAALNSVTVLKQRMLAAAAELMTQAADPDHCPICRTQFESGQLQRLMSQALQEGPNEILALAQNRLNEANESLSLASKRRHSLQSLVAFLGSGRTMSLRQALDRVRDARAALEVDRGRVKSLESIVAELAEQGLSESDIRSRLRDLGQAAAPAAEDLAAMVDSAAKLLSLQGQAVDRADAQLAKWRSTLSELSGLTARSADTQPDAHIQLLTERQASLDVLVSAMRTIDTVLDRDVPSDLPLELRLEQASDQLARLQAALGAEEHAASNAKSEEHKIADLTKALDERVGESDRLTKALEMLRDLLAKSKAGEFVNEVLRSNAAEISRIFSAIHAPNEFTIGAQAGGLKITRDETKDAATLNQMSTGQRAAYALSLFLSMNGRLRSGPPLIVLDDPIAHIDDLNILSFLDHLRELAIAGTRQIFIATADDKLAALIRQKFRFLGSERFVDLILSRE